MAKLTLEQLKDKHKELSDKRERNVNRYILPVEMEMEKIRLRIDEIELGDNF